MTTRPYLSFIQEAGKNQGCEFETIIPEWLYLVRKGNHSFMMQNINLGLNNSNTAKIIKSKSSTYKALNYMDIPCVEHHFLLNPNNPYYDTTREGSIEKAIRIFNSLNNRAVIKQEEGSLGKHVYLVDSVEELVSKLEMLFNEGLNVSICPFYESEFEYRVVVLNGQAKLSFAKERISSWKHNLSGGGAIVKDNLEKDVLESVHLLAEKTANSLTASFVTVDILFTNNQYKVLEVNGTVSLTKYMHNNEARRDRALRVFQEAFQLKIDRL